MWAFILTVSEHFNIQYRNYTDSNFMQNGIIVYSDQVQTVAPLGSITYPDMLQLQIPFLGGGRAQANLTRAITDASAQFSSYGRRNSRRIIVIMAITYNSGGEYSPLKVSTTFKENGGIIMAYSYVPTETAPNEQIKQLASSGYFFSSLNSSVEDLVEAQCDANCFCPNNFKSFISSTRNTPLHGCYYAVDLPSNYPLANSNCKRNYDDGYIASVQSLEKQMFLRNQTLGQTVLIGLHNLNGTWVWSDNQQLGDYHPWVYEPEPSQYTCIPENENNWMPIDRKEGFWYVCETKPCGCNNYCGDVILSFDIHT
ncbi:unnamed protein product [Auanema sp. JU1783]|nr:unnamed protein product [Auanema sp. JU1783]